MTWARVAETYVEAVVAGQGNMRVAEVYVEAVVEGLGVLRVAESYVEAVVSLTPPAGGGGWAVGSVRIA